MIEFTEDARRQVVAFMQEEDQQELAVRIAVRDSSPFAPEYDLSLIEPAERKPDDEVFDQEDFRLHADPESARFLEGATIDWVQTLQASGFRVENPNVKPLGAEAPEGPLAERVQQVLREQINPGVASHGGRVTLVDIRDRVVYLRMGGGCQGCGMAGVTLTRGIRRALQEAVPEIEGIEDVTDHAAGDNPYYEPSAVAG